MSFRPPVCHWATRGGWAYLVLFAGLVLLFTDLPAATPPRDKPAAKVDDPGTDLWRLVRRRAPELQSLAEKGEAGPVTTQANGVDAEALINAQGEQWRLYRERALIPFSMWVLGGVLLLVILLYLLFGIRARAPEDSGRRLLRFGSHERTLHWFMASVFLFLGISGLLLLWGRSLLLPLTGREAFSAIASASKEGHNLFGPVFLVALLLFLFRFGRRNLYQRGDFSWLAKGGGFIGVHQRAGFFNMGEKILFWLVILVGLAICTSGLALLFPNFTQSRQLMELAHLVHTLGAVALLSVILGHIYMALAVKGTLEGMKSGYVEYNWARYHHSEWADEMEKEGQTCSPGETQCLTGLTATQGEAGT